MSWSNVIMMTKKILSELGQCYHIDGSESDNYELSYHCDYNGYGLEIISYFETNYLHNDNQIKNNLQNISIFFCGKKYLSVRDNYYLHGDWEDVLQELYNKVYILKNEQEIYQQNINYIISNIIIPFESIESRDIINKILREKNIFMTVKDLQRGDVETYNVEYYKKYKIYKNQQLVLDIDYFGIKYDKQYKYQVNNCNFGNWEDEISDCLINAKEEIEFLKENNIISEKNKYLRLLRDK